MSRLAALLLVFLLGLAAVGLGALATPARADADRPILSYPAAQPTPTMGRPPADAAPALTSGVVHALAPADLLSSWTVIDTPPAMPGEGGWWVERAGHLAQNGVRPAASLSASATALLSPAAYGDVTVRAAFYDERNGNVGLIARHSERGFYQARLQTDPAYDGEALVVEKVVNGVAVPLALNAGEPLYTRHAWHTLALSVSGERIVVTFDGTVVAAVEDAAPLPAGAVGITTRAFGGIVFDQITLIEER